MDGVPIFNLARYGLRGAKIVGIRGLLNSTTNVILSAMEEGTDFDTALKQAQEAVGAGTSGRPSTSDGLGYTSEGADE